MRQEDYAKGAGLKSVRDRDHALIVHRQRQLHAAIVQGTGMASILRCANDLVTATLQHFESEERAMDDANLSTQIAHQQIHAGMVDTLEEISKELQQRSICGAMALMKFFDGTLAKHLAAEEAD
jgi:hemerythrin-like metal-binding protein